jgi:protease I
VSLLTETVPSAPDRSGPFNHLDRSGTYEVDVTARDADPERYDALVLPGGVANPDFLRAVT